MNCARQTITRTSQRLRLARRRRLDELVWTLGSDARHWDLREVGELGDCGPGDGSGGSLEASKNRSGHSPSSDRVANICSCTTRRSVKRRSTSSLAASTTARSAAGWACPADRAGLARADLREHARLLLALLAPVGAGGLHAGRLRGAARPVSRRRPHLADGAHPAAAARRSTRSTRSIVEDAADLISRVVPFKKVGRQMLHDGHMATLHAYHRHWACLLPQHGPGKKHDRRIELEPWQASSSPPPMGLPAGLHPVGRVRLHQPHRAIRVPLPRLLQPVARHPRPSSRAPATWSAWSAGSTSDARGSIAGRASP